MPAIKHSLLQYGQQFLVELSTCLVSWQLENQFVLNGRLDYQSDLKLRFVMRLDLTCNFITLPILIRAAASSGPGADHILVLCIEGAHADSCAPYPLIITLSPPLASHDDK